MRRFALRTIALLLLTSLLAMFFPAGVLAEVPVFNNLYLACDYLRACMDQRMTDMRLFLDENACPRWEEDELREVLLDTLSYCDAYSLKLNRYADRSADVSISVSYCDAVRMADAYFSGDTSNLSAEETECLAIAVEIAAQLKAQYGSGLALEKAIYDTICAGMSYKTYPDTSSDEFARITTVCSVLEDHVGNCQAYARMFYLLGTLTGLKVGFLSGWYADHDEGQHIWNTIELDGQLLMVDVTDGDLDNADSTGPQILYRCFNIGWDRVPDGSWNWWDPACGDNISGTTHPNLSYYNNQSNFGGCFYSLSEAAKACCQQAASGNRTYQFLLPDQLIDDEAMHQAIKETLERQGHAANWTLWKWTVNDDTIFHIRWDQF